MKVSPAGVERTGAPAAVWSGGKPSGLGRWWLDLRKPKEGVKRDDRPPPRTPHTLMKRTPVTREKPRISMMTLRMRCWDELSSWGRISMKVM